ncbi:MAG: acetyl-CoA carboxylase carboxyl transferase subunit alpha, partial [Bacteroidetes bacterium]|nr:acetyl-CoA carboxylase carboxyl transferase subunit alpha [Bacteroidota bacterium]
SVMSPESCSSILWRSWDFKETAAEALKLSATDMLGNGLIDGIIREPLGGAHNNPTEMFATLKKEILLLLADLRKMTVEEMVEKRIEKFSGMGVVQEI